jgi:glycosyltransferase involved in cell wall biosynthesis
VRIALVTTHCWPLPGPARIGDYWTVDLAEGLTALGHDVTMYSPEGTQFRNVRPVGCSFGKYTPTQHEHATLHTHLNELRAFDIVHDISTNKIVGLALAKHGRPVCMTLNGGPWVETEPPVNLCVLSNAQRERVLRGATDYEGSPTPELGGPPGKPVKDAHVVYLGVDTDFYCPTDYSKDDHVLWLNRWHPTKGYELAIRIAKETGLKLVMAGEHPDNETSDYQRKCALEARELARDVPNIDFRWLPGDPDHHTAKRELYRRAKALIYTTMFQEPFGLSMVEALACGTPVVATRMGSTPEVVSERKTGWLVNLDADVGANFINGASFGRSMTPSQYQRCRYEAVTRFFREAMAGRYLAEYGRIIAGERW